MIHWFTVNLRSVWVWASESLRSTKPGVQGKTRRAFDFSRIFKVVNHGTRLVWVWVVLWADYGSSGSGSGFKFEVWTVTWCHRVTESPSLMIWIWIWMMMHLNLNLMCMMNMMSMVGRWVLIFWPGASNWILRCPCPRLSSFFGIRLNVRHIAEALLQVQYSIYSVQCTVYYTVYTERYTVYSI